MAGKDSLSKSELDALKKEWLAEMKANMKANEKEAEDHNKTTEEKVSEQKSQVDNFLKLGKTSFNNSLPGKETI